MEIVLDDNQKISETEIKTFISQTAADEVNSSELKYKD
jgi:hypothetical protein